MVSFQISRLVFFAFFLFAGVTSGGGIIDVCPKSSSNFTVTFRYDPPYANANDRKWKGLLYDFVQWGLIRCFRQYSCDTKAIHWREISSEDRLSVDILHKKADIVMPITPSLTSSLTEELRNSKITGVTLFTVVKSPGLALVIDYHACKMKTEKLTTNTILSAWPVGAVILLLAGISGISIWALETSSNQQDFPSSFGKGSSEGFWWALITMTTVGYGDKVPRTIYGRMFSVLWILTGVCLIAIFTAAVTSAITVSSVDSDCKSTQGKHLAALNGSAAEKEARHQGANVTTYERESKMFDSLQAGEVEGVMLDRYKAYYYLDQLKNDHFRVALLLDVLLEYEVALMDRGFPEFTAKNGCLAKYFANSPHRVDRTMKHYISPVKPLGSATDTVGVLSINSTANQQLLITSSCIYALFLIAGLCWEFLYRRNHFNLFKTTLRNKTTCSLPLIAEQLTEVQEALSKLTSQVQKIQESLQAIGKIKPQTGSNQNDTSISEMSIIETETAS